ncbi:Inositol hexakisphosphate and diphosphoinositol-pentakisphosphate kinase [Plasmodiophora brassicae]
MAMVDVVVVGVCAMAKKVQSQPMRELLDRLSAYGDMQVVVFPESIILGEPVAQWPRVHCLIAFYSHGFPLEKAIEYSRIEPRPFLVNDLEAQKVLKDRRSVYRVLEENGIPVPFHVVMDRDPGAIPPTLEEFDDRIIIDGHVLEKPFVEKPVEADDHNINVYYPGGGGCRHLFRKVKNRSSEVLQENRVRRVGSYVYEKFVPTGRDIKVFAVGQDYAYSESRKSPTVDGIVERNRFGKERRQTERLTDSELAMASCVTRCFRQTVCGLDILRDGSKSYVIDVNGWSFVKGSSLYYDECSRILRQTCLSSPQVLQLNRPRRQLLGIVAVFRHSDRTPKQKLKISITDMEVIQMFFPDGLDPVPPVEFKLKRSSELEALSNIIRSLRERDPKYDAQFSGIATVLAANFVSTKVQIKLDVRADEELFAMIICKWGGEMTAAGVVQSQSLGRRLRQDILDCGADPNVIIPGTRAYSGLEHRVRCSAETFLRTFTNGRESALQITVEDGGDVSRLLDDTSASKNAVEASKVRLLSVLMSHVRGCVFDPDLQVAAKNALRSIDNPVERLTRLLASTKALITYLESQLPGLTGSAYHGESWQLLLMRWKRMYKCLFDSSTGVWDVTKVPDIFDSALYDMLHNADRLPELKELLGPVHHNARILADFVVPQEFGISLDEKRSLAAMLSAPLNAAIASHCKEISKVVRENDHPRCFLYFTNESHMHALRNALLVFGIAANRTVATNLEHMQLGYCSHAIFRVFRHEDGSCSVSTEFSPGAVEHPSLVTESHVQKVAVPTPLGSIPLQQFCESVGNTLPQPISRVSSRSNTSLSTTR